MNDIQERDRHPAPGPRNIGIAAHEDRIWVGSVEEARIFEMNRANWANHSSADVPGEPIGMTANGEELLVVVGQGDDDDRYIYRFVPTRGFFDKRPCPEFTGSHLAVDASGSLFLSQAHNRRILQLDSAGNIVRTIELPRVPVGMTILDDYFYLVTTENVDNNEAYLGRIGLNSEGAYEDLARIPFKARGLAYDATAFWSNDRGSQQVVVFTQH